MVLLIVLVLAAVAMTNARQLNSTEFAEYQRMYPEEFSGEFEGDIVVEPGFRNALIGARRWTNNIVPYDISGMSAYAQRRIRDALTRFEEAIAPNCVQFVERTNQRNYIEVYSGTGCSSSIGMRGSRQRLSLRESGCLRIGTIQHEFLHAMGFMHEQCRSDRDNNIVINYENIRQGKAGNFRRANTNNLNTPYYYRSVMHYGNYAFSKNGRPTIVPNDPNAQIGLRIGISAGDIDTQRVRNFYGCGAGAPTPSPTTPSPSTDSDCRDTTKRCASWKNAGYCKTNAFTQKNCKKSCGTC